MQAFLFSHGSYLGIIGFLILTGFGLPIPEEVPIVMAGALSTRGAMLPSLAFCSCLIGALVGDCVMYAIGYHFGHNLLKDHPKLAHWIQGQSCCNSFFCKHDKTIRLQY